jgi:hypothetical protein
MSGGGGVVDFQGRWKGKTDRDIVGFGFVDFALARFCRAATSVRSSQTLLKRVSRASVVGGWRTEVGD